jgi:hypothetical protein
MRDQKSEKRHKKSYRKPVVIRNYSKSENLIKKIA